MFPAQDTSGRIDLDPRELRRGGGLQRRNRRKRKCKQAAICQLEYDPSCRAVVPRGGSPKPLFPRAALTAARGGDLCENLGVAQSALSHDTFSTARAASRRSPRRAETPPRHPRLAFRLWCERQVITYPLG